MSNDQRRWTTSNSEVPEASETSLAYSPVSMEAHIVLRQQQLANPFEVARLVVAHPQQLGQREAGQHGIGGVLQDVVAADGLIDGVHLRLAALIAPDEATGE